MESVGVPSAAPAAPAPPSSVEHGTGKNKNNDEETAMLNTKVAAKNMGAATGTIEDNGEIAIENLEQGISSRSRDELRSTQNMPGNQCVNGSKDKTLAPVDDYTLDITFLKNEVDKMKRTIEDMKKEHTESKGCQDATPLIANIARNDDGTENNDDTENNEDDAGEKIPPDAFSMLFIAKTYSEHALPIGVFVLQILILVLISLDLLQTYDREVITFMNIPVIVPLSVTVSQCIACIVSVLSADDLVYGVLHVNKRPIDIKWEVSNIMRIVEGVMVIGVSLIFIVQSSTAIDLWLNFAAVQFVGQLDNLAFALAKMNFFRNAEWELAKRVSEYRVHDNSMQTFKRTARIIWCVMLIVMIAGLSFIFYTQYNLHFACKSITITVGESSSAFPLARYLSGTYIRENARINGRAVYVQKQGTNGAFLAYCGSINQWTVSSYDDESRGNIDDPCYYFDLQSETTRTYDVAEIKTLRLPVRNGGVVIDAEIKCNDCNPNAQAADCGFSGYCNTITKSCDCYYGYFGQQCQFEGPCTEMVMQNAFHGFDGGKSFDLAYFDGRLVMVKDRPVYFQKLSDGNLLLIGFDGGRWVVLLQDEFWDWKEEETSLFEYLENDFNPLYSEYEAYFVSEYSNHGSPMGVPFRAQLSSDEGEDSYLVRLGDEEFDLLCADCTSYYNYTRPGGVSCQNRWGQDDNSMCMPTKSTLHGIVNRCNCAIGFDGPTCNIRPVEGTVSVHLDHTTGVCSVCGEGNTWVTYELDGNSKTCLSFAPLQFVDFDGTLVERKVSLNLNMTHFSVFVSKNADASVGCEVKDGTKEIHSITRIVADDDIKINYAIHLNRTKSFFGEIVGSENIGCSAVTDSEESRCSIFTDLKEVYSTTSGASSLDHAWLLLNLKITPMK